MLQHSLDVPRSGLDDWLKSVPESAAVFALFGHDAGSGPYISRTTNLRRRLRRLLVPNAPGTKRLHLAGRVARLAYSPAGSPFAMSLLLLRANRAYCGERAKARLHLRPPALLRMARENPYPRVYVTTRLSHKALASTFGPFPAKAVAERFLDDSLNFFELRRCFEDLIPDPAFPGCVYSEMKMCLAPCFRGCTDERYAQEAETVREYFATRGAATMAELERARDAASAALDFEAAARLHQRLEKMAAVAQQAAPLVHAIADLDAVIVQPAVHREAHPVATPAMTETMSNRALQSEGAEVAIFLVRAGRILGPEVFSVEGMRHPNERAGSTSLFAHPTLLEPTALETAAASAVPPSAGRPRGRLEERLQATITALDEQLLAGKFPVEERSEHLSLLARWYYRPPARRMGEIFFRGDDGAFSLPSVLRGVSRVYRGQTEAPEPAEAAAAWGSGTASAP